MDVRLERQQLGSRQDFVAHLILARPSHANAMTGEMIQSLHAHLTALKDDPHVRLLVLRGDGKNFCAGADITWMKQSGQASAEENRHEALLLQGVFRKVHEFPRPTVAMVQGACFGGGLGLVSVVDFAAAEASSRFALSEVKLGLIPAVISPFLIQRIGAGHFMRLGQFAETIDLNEARRVGLVHAEVTQTTLEERISLALKGAPSAHAAMRRLTTISEDVHQHCLELLTIQRASVEAQKGLTAFLNRHEPSWSYKL